MKVFKIITNKYLGRILSSKFLLTFTYTDDGLYKLRLDYVRVRECSAGLEIGPAGARKRRKATL